MTCVLRSEGIDGSGGRSASDGQKEELEGAQNDHHNGFLVWYSNGNRRLLITKNDIFRASCTANLLPILYYAYWRWYHRRCVVGAMMMDD